MFLKTRTSFLFQNRVWFAQISKSSHTISCSYGWNCCIHVSTRSTRFANVCWEILSVSSSTQDYLSSCDVDSTTQCYHQQAKQGWMHQVPNCFFKEQWFFGILTHFSLEYIHRCGNGFIDVTFNMQNWQTHPVSLFSMSSHWFTWRLCKSITMMWWVSRRVLSRVASSHSACFIFPCQSNRYDP